MPNEVKYFCCSPDCPGLPYRASELAHPPGCGSQRAAYRRAVDGDELILSCPFCEQGGAAALPLQSGLRWLCAVECHGCGAVGPVKFSFAREESRALAVAAWNRVHGRAGDRAHGMDRGVQLELEGRDADLL